MPIYTTSFFRIDDFQRSECCQNYLHQRRASYSPQIYDVYSTAVYLAAACVCYGPGKRSDSDISHTWGGAAAFFRFYNWLHASKILCAAFNNLREVLWILP